MKFRNLVGAAIAGAAMLLSVPVRADAAVVLDQLSQAPTNVGNTNYVSPVGYFDPQIFVNEPYAGSRASFVQTITAGINGTLDHVNLSELFDFGDGALVISLIDGDYGAGARTIVGQSILDFPDNLFFNPPNNFNLTFKTNSFNYSVKNGQKFSILFESTIDSTGMVFFNIGPADYDFENGVVKKYYFPDYSDGELIYILDDVPYSFIPEVPTDITFATYVDTGAVPEPATWAMMIIGFGAIGASMRRRAAARPEPALG